MNAEPEIDDVIRLIRDHLDDGWQELGPEDILIKTIASGFINRNYMIESKRNGQKLLLKLYGGNGVADEEEITLPIEQEILVCDTWSRIGGGPKLLAVFPGGRIEEFIESHTITPTEYQDERILKQLAHAVATFHSMKLPFRKPAFDFHHLLTRMHQDFVQNERERILKNPIWLEKKMDISEVVNHDYASDLKWLKHALEPDHHRMVYTHGDLHGHNILIRSNNGQPVLIDLQESGFSWRGRDLGLLLINSVTDMNDLSHASPAFPSKEFCFTFFHAYMDQMERLKLFQDIDRSGRDSNQHLMMEMLIGGMVSVMYVILLIMNRHESMFRTSTDLAVS